MNRNQNVNLVQFDPCSTLIKLLKKAKITQKLRLASVYYQVKLVFQTIVGGNVNWQEKTAVQRDLIHEKPKTGPFRTSETID